MISKLLKLFLYITLILIISILYLVFFGIETKRFNSIITEKISNRYENVDLKLNEVKIIVDTTIIGLALETKNPQLLIEGNEIKINKIKTSFPIINFFKNDFLIKNINIVSGKNDLKQINNAIRVFRNTPELFLLNKILKKGTIVSNIKLFFEDDGNNIKDYRIEGSINDVVVKLFNNNEIKSLNFNFKINPKNYEISNTKAIYKELKLESEEIKITKEQDFFEFKGNISNEMSKISLSNLDNIFKINLSSFNLKDLELKSDHTFSFQLRNKIKISDFKINSNINIKKLLYKKKNNQLKKYFLSSHDSISFIEHKIELNLKNKKINIKGNGNFTTNGKLDQIDYEISSNDKVYKYKTKINLNNTSFNVPVLNYFKDDKTNSSIIIDGSLDKQNSIIIKKILFEENNNKLEIEDLHFNKLLKITNINLIDLNFVNKANKKNQLKLFKNKKNYTIESKVFDGTFLINEILNSETENNFFDILNNFDSNIIIKINKFYIHNEDYLNDLYASLKFNNSNLINLDLKGNFSDKKKLNLSIKTNQNNEKITTLYSGYAKPLVKKYKFIKGFDEGYLDFYSIKSNNVSKSNLKVNDFKLKELPALTKILTLASLQGIADLLTGEGIRFNEFEMKFRNEKKLMTINEIYAIGPAISILMDGYIQNGELVSLRGTLVPATTLNKVIGSIPFLGNILVGKKTGEGVFGVSFKIKGPPKQLKTTVNPIKTLTPRFITRTLEKIKETN